MVLRPYIPPLPINAITTNQRFQNILKIGAHSPPLIPRLDLEQLINNYESEISRYQNIYNIGRNDRPARPIVPLLPLANIPRDYQQNLPNIRIPNPIAEITQSFTNYSYRCHLGG